MNMNYHIIQFLFWFLYSFICSVKVQIWCKLNAYSFTLGNSFLYNFLCIKESGVFLWATTSYLISHMKNTFASATNSDKIYYNRWSWWCYYSSSVFTPEPLNSCLHGFHCKIPLFFTLLHFWSIIWLSELSSLLSVS